MSVPSQYCTISLCDLLYGQVLSMVFMCFLILSAALHHRMCWYWLRWHQSNDLGYQQQLGQLPGREGDWQDPKIFCDCLWLCRRYGIPGVPPDMGESPESACYLPDCSVLGGWRWHLEHSTNKYVRWLRDSGVLCWVVKG